MLVFSLSKEFESQTSEAENGIFFILCSAKQKKFHKEKNIIADKKIFLNIF